MEYQIEENSLTIFLPAELDHCNAEQVRKRADMLIEHNHIKYVIFDFANTNFMDSSGIGVLMGRYKLVYLVGGADWAENPHDRNRKIFKMPGETKLNQMFEEEKQ